MKIPKLPAETRPFLWGAAAGAIALAIVGFNWGGWMLGSSAEAAAAQRADTAVVAALAPICVAQFRSGAKAKASLAEMQEIDEWQRTEYVTRGGWATMPGSASDVEPNRDVASACAQALSAPAVPK